MEKIGTKQLTRADAKTFLEHFGALPLNRSGGRVHVWLEYFEDDLLRLAANPESGTHHVTAPSDFAFDSLCC